MDRQQWGGVWTDSWQGCKADYCHVFHCHLKSECVFNALKTEQNKKLKEKQQEEGLKEKVAGNQMSSSRELSTYLDIALGGAWLVFQDQL